MTLCLLMVSCAVWVGFVQSEALVIALLCLAATGSAAYMVNYFAFGQDVAPSHTGLVIGYLGGLGNLFAAGFMPVAGWISEGRSGFTPNFVIIGLLPLGRPGRAARVLAPGRHKTRLDGSLAFWHHSRSTLQTFPFQGVRLVRGTRPVLNPPRALSPLHHERGWYGDDPSFLGVAGDDGARGVDHRGLRKLASSDPLEQR